MKRSSAAIITSVLALVCGLICMRACQQGAVAVPLGDTRSASVRKTAIADPGEANKEAAGTGAERTSPGPLVQRAGIRGRIVGGSNEPIEGAKISIGTLKQSRAGFERQTLGAGAKWVGESGPDGNYEVILVDAGCWHVEITADGFSSLILRLHLGHTMTERDFVLQRAASLVGTVNNDDGTPAVGAIVIAGPREPFDLELRIPPHAAPEKWPLTRTDEQGAFVFRSIDPGPVYAVAGIWSADPAGPTMMSHAAFSIEPGEQKRWMCVLARSSRLRVSFVDEAGEEVMASKVYAICGETGGPSAANRRVLNLSPTGRSNGPKRTVWTSVHSKNEPHAVIAEFGGNPERVERVRRDGILPGDQVTLITVKRPQPSIVDEVGAVKGRIVDPGKWFGTRVFHVELYSKSRRHKCDFDGQEFSGAEVPVGDWRVRVVADDSPVLVGPWFKVDLGRMHDLGNLSISQPGTVDIEVVDRGGGDVSSVDYASIRNDLYAYSLTLEAPGRFVGANITPGEYQAVLIGKAGLATGKVVVASGHIARVTVDNTPAIRKTVELWLPPPDSWTTCVVETRTGRSELRSKREVLSNRMGWRPVDWAEMLPFGPVLIATTIDGIEKPLIQFDCEPQTSHLRQICVVR